MQIKKYDIVLVILDPVQGSEKRGTRPCLVVQNNEVNASSQTTVVCPFTTKIKDYFFLLKVLPSRDNGLSEVSCLDLLQIRVVDQKRILKNLGRLEVSYYVTLKKAFIESFDLDDMFES